MITTWAGWSAARETDALTQPRMMLGARLRRLRERSGLPLDAAAAAVGSTERLEAMERGMTRSDARAVIALAELYEVTDHQTRVALLELVRLSHQEGWWAPYRPLIHSWFLPYLGAEQAADNIRCYTREVVPDLLQHPEYARAMIRLRHPQAGEPEIDQRLRLLLRRQQILYDKSPAHVWAIVDQGAFTNPRVPASAMFRQLCHLVELCELPHVTVQFDPLCTSFGKPLSLVRLPGEDIRLVVFLQMVDTGLYPEESDFHRHKWNTAAIQVPPPEETPAALEKMIVSL